MRDPRYRFALETGSEIAGYRIVEVLGAGSFGIRYRGHHEASGRPVAIQEFFLRGRTTRSGSAVVVDPSVSQAAWAEALDAFAEDWKPVIVRFQHPNIVQAEATVRANNTIYLITEPVDGVTLEDQLVEHGTTVSEVDVKRLFEPLVDSVGYAHQRQVLHRNLTPRAVVIRSDGQPVLTDFGPPGRGLDRSATASSYASPESVDTSGKTQPGQAADIYSLGAMLYRAVTGSPPPPVEERTVRPGFMAPKGTDTFVPASQVAGARDRFTEAFLAGVDRALALDPAERPQSANELRDALGWPITAVATRNAAGDEAAPAAEAPVTPAETPVDTAETPTETPAKASVTAIGRALGARARRSWPVAAALAALLAGGAFVWPQIAPKVVGSGMLSGPLSFSTGTYWLAATRDGATIRLTGQVPTDMVRTSIEEAVQRADEAATVVNKLAIAAGAPGEFEETARVALFGIGDLAAGSVRIEGREIRIEGTAASHKGYRFLQREAQRILPPGWHTRVAVLPPIVSPFTFALELEPNRIVATGHVPDEATLRRILDLARRAQPGITLQDQTEIAGGADSSFAELAGIAASRLADLSFGRAAISGSELSFEGRARSVDGYASLKRVKPTAGRLTLAVTSAMVQPFELKVAASQETVTLAGYAPGEQVRADLVAAATSAAGGRAVKDDMKIADGAPADFHKAALFAINLLPRLATANLTLSGRTLLLDGQARGAAEYTDLTRVLAAGEALPDGFTIERNTIPPTTISPYAWTATIEGGGVRLTGYVPSPSVRAEIAAAAAQASAGRGSVDDRTLYAAGAPAGIGKAAAVGLAQLPRLSGGRVSMTDDVMTVEGTAATPGAHAAILADLAKPIPGGVTARSAVAPAPLAKFEFSIESGPGRARMTGYLPSPEARVQVVEALRKALGPQTAIADEVLQAGGAPEGFTDLAAVAATRLVELAEGRVDLVSENRAPPVLRIAGVARSHDAYARSVALNGEPLPAGATLRSEVRPAVASPFEWAVEIEPQSLVVTGFVPSAEIKSELSRLLVEAAQGRSVRDDTKVAEGAPAGFAAGARFLAAQAAQLQRGRVGLRDQTLAVEGRAAGSAEFDGLKKAAQTLPTGWRASKFVFQPPLIEPFAWSVQVTPGSARIVGYIPVEGMRREMMQVAAKEFGATPIKDDTAIGDGAPESFSSMVQYGLKQARRLASGRVTYEGGQLKIAGVAADPEAHAQFTRDLGRLPNGVTLAEAAVTPAVVPNFSFRVEVGPRRARLTGHVPSEEFRGRAIETIRRGLPGATVTDDTRIAAGDTAGFIEAIAFGLASVADLAEARFAIEDGEIRLEGRTRTGEAYAAMRELGRKPGPGGLRVNVAVQPPWASSFEWAATIDRSGVVLSGSVPTEEARKDMLALANAAASGKTLRDETTYADGAPQGFEALIKTAIEIAPKLAQGRISVKDRAVTIEGQAANPEGFEAIRRLQQPGGLPQGLRLARFAVTPPLVSPYSWALIKRGSEVKITGFVPTESVRREVMAAVGQVDGWRVSGELHLGDGAPDRFLETLRRAMAQGARLETGAVSITDGTVSIAGTASTPEAHAALMQDMGAAVSAGRARVDVKPAAVTNYVWNATVDRGAIRLTGYVPDDETRRRIADTIRPNLSRNQDLLDNTRIAAGARGDFAALSAFAVKRVLELSEGSVSLGPAVLKIKGTPHNLDAHRSLGDALAAKAALPAGITVEAELKDPKGADPAFRLRSEIAGAPSTTATVPPAAASPPSSATATPTMPLATTPAPAFSAPQKSGPSGTIVTLTTPLARTPAPDPASQGSGPSSAAIVPLTTPVARTPAPAPASQGSGPSSGTIVTLTPLLARTPAPAPASPGPGPSGAIVTLTTPLARTPAPAPASPGPGPSGAIVTLTTPLARTSTPALASQGSGSSGAMLTLTPPSSAGSMITLQPPAEPEFVRVIQTPTPATALEPSTLRSFAPPVSDGVTGSAIQATEQPLRPRRPKPVEPETRVRRPVSNWTPFADCRNDRC